jgi:hypothetical protein
VTLPAEVVLSGLELVNDGRPSGNDFAHLEHWRMSAGLRRIHGYEGEGMFDARSVGMPCNENGVEEVLVVVVDDDGAKIKRSCAGSHASTRHASQRATRLGAL